jgi:hypothetical protein
MENKAVAAAAGEEVGNLHLRPELHPAYVVLYILGVMDITCVGKFSTVGGSGAPFRGRPRAHHRTHSGIEVQRNACETIQNSEAGSERVGG